MLCITPMMSCLADNHKGMQVTTNGSSLQPDDIKPNLTIYHEKQSRELCALHALNNLFQDATAFTRKQLDEICFSLSPNHLVNPHKSLFGLGNYDVNVIMAAVQTKCCEAIWFDKRRNVHDIDVERIHGFILNIPIEYKLGFLKFPSYRKHWIGVRKINGLYYNLDSKLERAEIIGGDSEMCNYLEDHLTSQDKELLLIVDSTVAEDRTWLRPSGATENGGKSEEVVDAKVT